MNLRLFCASLSAFYAPIQPNFEVDFKPNEVVVEKRYIPQYWNELFYLNIAQSAGAIEYTDCFSAEG